MPTLAELRIAEAESRLKVVDFKLDQHKRFVAQFQEERRKLVDEIDYWTPHSDHPVGAMSHSPEGQAKEHDCLLIDIVEQREIPQGSSDLLENARFFLNSTGAELLPYRGQLKLYHVKTKDETALERWSQLRDGQWKLKVDRGGDLYLWAYWKSVMTKGSNVRKRYLSASEVRVVITPSE